MEPMGSTKHEGKTMETKDIELMTNGQVVKMVPVFGSRHERKVRNAWNRRDSRNTTRTANKAG